MQRYIKYCNCKNIDEINFNFNDYHRLYIGFSNYRTHVDQENSFKRLDVPDADFLHFRMETPQTVRNVAGRIDYTIPIGKSNLEVGSRYTHNYSESDSRYLNHIAGEFEVDDSRKSRFSHTEDIASIYASLDLTVNDKLSFTAGLRGEYLHSLSNQVSENPDKWTTSDFRLFPSMQVSYSLSPKLNLSYAITNQLKRPGFESMNNRRTYINENSYTAGNPYLKNTTLFNQDLTLVINKAYIFSLTHNRTSNEMGGYVLPVEDDPNSTYTSVFNFGNEQITRLLITVPVSLGSGFLRTQFSGGVEHLNQKIKDENVKEYYSNNSNTYAIAQINNTFTLSRENQFWASPNMSYQTVSTDRMYKVVKHPTFSGYLKKGWGDWTTTLNWGYVFAKTPQKMFLNPNQKHTPFLKYTTWQQGYGWRSISIRASYVFGNSKLKGVRKAKIADEETQSRF